MQETQIWSSASFWKRNTILLVAAATTPPKPSAFPSNLDCVIKNPLWCCTDAKLKTFMILTVDVVMPWVPFDKIFWAVSKDPNRKLYTATSVFSTTPYCRSWTVSRTPYEHLDLIVMLCLEHQENVLQYFVSSCHFDMQHGTLNTTHRWSCGTSRHVDML